VTPRSALASLRLGVSLLLAYRLEVVIVGVSASIVTLLNWSLWTALFVGRDSIAGRTAAELTTYVVVAWVITTFHGTRVDERLAARFRTGDIAVDLLRPWSLQAHVYLRALGRSGAALLLTTAPLALWTGLLLPMRGPERPSTWLFFGMSLLLAQAISFGISWLVGVAAFRLRNSVGLSHLKATSIGVLSGALIPLDLYPPAMRRVVDLLPFQGMSHTPASIFIETVPAEQIAPALALQAAWALGLALAGAVAFRAATRRMVVQGG